MLDLDFFRTFNNLCFLEAKDEEDRRERDFRLIRVRAGRNLYDAINRHNQCVPIPVPEGIMA